MTHRNGLHSAARHRHRRTLVALLATVGATAGLAISAAPADAILFGKLNTTTTLSASVASATEGTEVTLNASVKISTVNSLGILPTGTVTFKSKNAMGVTVTLGTSNLRECFLVPCHAFLTSSTIPVGTTTAIAVYNGDSHTNGSQGSTPLSITMNNSPGDSSEVTCYPGQACSSGTLQSDANDSTTQLTVSSPSSGTPQTVTASLGDGTLHCNVSNPDESSADAYHDHDVRVGALAEFHVTGANATTITTYTGVGETGRIMKAQLYSHPFYAGCYGQDSPFYGFTNGHYGLAPFNSEDGLYVAQLPTCQFRTNRLPCLTGAGPGDGTSYSYKLREPATGDPKTIG